MFALALAQGAAAGAAAPARAADAAMVAALDPEPSLDLLSCPGGARAAAAGPYAVCPPLDTVDERAPAIEPPERDFPEWLGNATGWWGGGGGPSADPTERPRHLFLVAPFLTSSPLVGLGFGVAAAGTVQLGDREKTQPSKYATNVLFTTNKQFSIPLRTTVNLPGGDWKLMGLWRWSKFPSPTWGLGGNTPDSAESTVDYSLLRLHETASRRIVGDLYVGVGLSLDYYYGVSAGPTAGGGPSTFSQYPFGTGPTSLSFGPGMNLLWDSRDSAVNPSRGAYASASYAYVPRWLGSTTSWQSVYLDLRSYVPLWRRLVVALWGYGWFAFGDVPYLELPAVGSDPDARSGRGYTEGRHIGKSLLYGEVELRYSVWEWLGLVAGLNVHSAGQPEAQGLFPDEPRFRYWYPAVVAGLRVTMVKQTRSNLCVDVAFGQGSNGVYVNFSEAF